MRFVAFVSHSDATDSEFGGDRLMRRHARKSVSRSPRFRHRCEENINQLPPRDAKQL
jgi:hypothetical protein